MNDKFLPMAQWLKTPDIDVGGRPIIDDFECKFVGFGSCFAQNLQANIERFGFDFWFNRDICAHYSTESIANILEIVSSGRDLTEDDLFFVGDDRDRIVAYPFYFKKHFFGPNAAENLLKRMKRLVAECAEKIRECDCAVITLGTPRILRLRHNGKVLNTATNIGPDFWQTEMLSVEQNVAQLERIYASIAKIRGGEMPTIFVTVSPQRYLFADGVPGIDADPFIDNMLGKSILRVAVDAFAQNHVEDVIYYPSYEIVMDELRFLETLSHYDFTHIDQVHTPQHVVKKFLQAFCTDAVIEQLNLIEELESHKNHFYDFLTGGMAPNDKRLLVPLKNMLAKLDGIEGTPSPKFVDSLVAMLNGLDQAVERTGIADEEIGEAMSSLAEKISHAMPDSDKEGNLKLLMFMKGISDQGLEAQEAG